MLSVFSSPKSLPKTLFSELGPKGRDRTERGKLSLFKTVHSICAICPKKSGCLNERVAKSFQEGKFTRYETKDWMTLYRVCGGKAKIYGHYWSKTHSPTSFSAKRDYALSPEWGNTGVKLATLRVPPGTAIIEGKAAPQGNLPGGANQIYIPEVSRRWEISLTMSSSNHSIFSEPRG